MTIPNQVSPKLSFRLPTDLQFFADDAGSTNGDSGTGDNPNNNGDNPTDTENQGGNGNPSNSQSLDDLLKDPTFKAQYQNKLQETLNKRMKKYDGVDLEEYNRMKQEEEDRQNANLTDLDKKDKEIEKLRGQIDSIATREKALAVKEYCVENGFNPKLVSRLIDLSAIKGGDGQYEGLDEAVQSLQEEFPEIVKAQDTTQSTQTPPPASSYNAGSDQRGNTPPASNPYLSGKSLAEQRNQARLERKKQFDFKGGNE